jgi:hypothetical protein
MREFRSLQGALEGHFEKRRADLPDKLRQRIEQDLVLIAGIWDHLSADQRREAAREWDFKHDPAFEEDRQRSWDAEVQRQELERQIAQWEATLAPTALDLAKKESRLAELRRELVEALASGVVTVAVAEPQAVARRDRARKPTPDEMAAWYKQRVIEHDPRDPPPSRPEDEKAAKAHFRSVGLKMLVRAARNEFAPIAWKESGPKGRKVHARSVATQPGLK